MQHIEESLVLLSVAGFFGGGGGSRFPRFSPMRLVCVYCISSWLSVDLVAVVHEGQSCHAPCVLLQYAEAGVSFLSSELLETR